MSDPVKRNHSRRTQRDAVTRPDDHSPDRCAHRTEDDAGIREFRLGQSGAVVSFLGLETFA
jgi:hypothetical protein